MSNANKIKRLQEMRRTAYNQWKIYSRKEQVAKIYYWKGQLTAYDLSIKIILNQSEFYNHEETIKNLETQIKEDIQQNSFKN